MSKPTVDQLDAREKEIFRLLGVNNIHQARTEIKDYQHLQQDLQNLKDKYKDLLDTKTQVHMRAMKLQQELDKLKRNG